MDSKSLINNEYDYSNVIMKLDYVVYIVQYLDGLYKKLQELIEQDEEKNNKLKYEYRNYQYRKSYRERFDIYIRPKSYNSLSCKNLESFKSAIENGYIKNINELEIKLNLSYEKGTERELEKYDNEFKIIMHPYKIVFTRTSNHNEDNINKIESRINEIFKKLPKENTIFCTKE